MKTNPTLLWALPLILILSACTAFPLTGTARAEVAAPEERDAGFVVVDTGQQRCFDSASEIPCPQEGAPFAGQDAQSFGPTPAYQDNGDGTITDLATGLMWSQDYSGKMTWSEAQAAAEALTLAGHTDWRLPTITELYSLIDFSGSEPPVNAAGDPNAYTPFIDTSVFNFAYGDTSSGERLIDAQTWSSTAYSSTTMHTGLTIFGVNFADGRIKGYGASRPNGEEMTQYVRFVRGDPGYGQNLFTDNGDGTLTDLAAGLMWTQSDSGAGMDWEDALAYCQTLETAGHTDWQLPDAKQLQSIVDYDRSPDATGSAAIDPLFQTTPIVDEGGETNYPYFWTSTTHKNTSSSPGRAAVYIAFGEALGWMQNQSGDYVLMDVHGAGSQRSDPKTGSASDYPHGFGPQGDVVRIENYARCVRTAPAESGPSVGFLPLVLGAPRGTAETSGVTDGAYLIAPLQETSATLMDAEGQIVQTWESAYRPGNAAYLLENGNLLRMGNTRSQIFTAGEAGGIVEEIAPDGAVVWSFTHDNAEHRLHHDLEPLPNGNILMITWEMISEADALSAGRDPSLLNDGELWVDAVIEVNPQTNAIVWEWRLWDHLIQEVDPAKENYGDPAAHPELVDLNYTGPGARPGQADWTHINAIDYNERLDQILLSVRNFSEIWIIDHSPTTAEAAGPDGDLLYRWGNPRAYGAGSSAHQQLFVQHDAQWIEDGLPGAGNILIFNNGLAQAGRGYSSVDEITPPLQEDGAYTLPQAGQGFAPAAPAWRYTADPPTDFYAANISGAQRLPDGSTLICDGPRGRFFVVSASGDILREDDVGGEVFRVVYYPAEYPGVEKAAQ